MRLQTLIFAIMVIAASFAGATVGMQYLWPNHQSGQRPALAEVPPLPPVTRTSTIVTPVSISLSAVRDVIEREAPRDYAGKRDVTIGQGLSKAEINWTATRGPLVLAGRPEAVVASAAVNGTLRASGQLSPETAGSVGNAISSFLGQDAGRTVERFARSALDQRGDVRGNVTIMSRPVLSPAWRLEPNLSAQVSVADANISFAGMRFNVASEVKPQLDRYINEQISAQEARLRDDTLIERVSRREWDKLCRSIPLGKVATGVPNLWLEVRPTRAFAAQPRIDASNIVLTLGVQAETRIVPAETTPECPFPPKLDLVQQTEEGRVNIALPIDIPFTEVNRLIEARLAGKTLPVAHDSVLAIQGATVAASGDRLLISLRLKANDGKSWFGLGSEATVHVWGRPVLDRDRQVLRLTDIALDVKSEQSIAGAVATAVKAYLEAVLAQSAVIDLKPFAANARTQIETALADFRVRSDNVRFDANVKDLRLVGVAFDAQTLRVFAEADGSANVTVTSLPER